MAYSRYLSIFRRTFKACKNSHKSQNSLNCLKTSNTDSYSNSTSYSNSLQVKVWSQLFFKQTYSPHLCLKNIGLTRHSKRLVVGAMVSLIAVGSLTGCGQKGALYLPEEAPSNTDFILYKNNKPKVAIEPTDVEENNINNKQMTDTLDSIDPNAVSNDPEDY